MKLSTKNKILDKIKKRGRGYVFSASDFILDFKRYEIDQSFKSLLDAEIIKKVLTGIYYYPEYSQLLEKYILPDINKVVDLISKKNNWKIFPEGNTALNYLGLSTQIPAKYIYISTGPSRKYNIENLTLEFKHRIQKESGISDENTNLVVQAIKAIGKVQAQQENFIKKLSSCYSENDWIKIEKKAKNVPYWILEVIIKAKEFAK